MYLVTKASALVLVQASLTTSAIKYLQISFTGDFPYFQMISLLMHCKLHCRNEMSHLQMIMIMFQYTNRVQFKVDYTRVWQLHDSTHF